MEQDGSWDNVEDAPVDIDPEDLAGIGIPSDDDEVVAQSDGEEFQMPRGVPQPKAPSREVRLRHNLTHLPYAGWCPWCVMGRKCNSPHFQSDGSDRSIPLLVMDYAFVRNKEDEVLATMLAGRLYPSRRPLACIVDGKGVDPYAAARMSTFIRESGLSRFNFVYKSDQEGSLVAMMEKAVEKSGRQGIVVPGNSAVGESASNGRAERTVQAIEDMLRVHKLALEHSIGAQVPSDHAIARWLVEHVADVMFKYTVNPNGLSPYEELHCRKARERRVEFGERVFFNMPKKGRAKLNRRWRLGIYLGHCSNSNEQYIVLINGNVIKARSTTRVVQESKWSAKLVLGIAGTPADLRLTADEELTADEVESSEAPHEFDRAEVEPGDDLLDPKPKPDSAGEAEKKDDEANVRDAHPPPIAEGELRLVRITKADLEKYGYTAGCPRCARLEYGQARTKLAHNDECRRRMYKLFKRDGDNKWHRASQDIQGKFAQSQPAEWKPDSVLDARNKASVERLKAQLKSRRSANSGEPQASNADGDQPPPAKAPRTGPQSSERPSPRGAPQSFSPSVAPNDDDKFLPGLESDDEDFREPPAKKRCGDSQRDRPEEKAADLFAPSDDEAEESKTVHALVSSGVDRALAVKKAKDLIAPDEATFMELYGRGAIMREANGARRDLNVHGLAALDIRTYKPDGTTLDFTCRKDRKQAMDLIDKEDPLFIIGSPLCTAFCSWSMFGLETPAEGGGMALALKPTKFMTNSMPMAKLLNRRCDKSHVHQLLTSGRCANVAFYPLPLVRTLIRGIRNTKIQERKKSNILNALVEHADDLDDFNGKVFAVADTGASVRTRVSKVGDGHIELDWDGRDFKEVYRDEYTNGVLPPHPIKEAIKTKLSYSNSRVSEGTGREGMAKFKDAKLVRCRWVLSNKGDAQNPDVRARLVACEVNHNNTKSSDFYASTPPLEAKRMLFSKYANEPIRNGEKLQLGFIDVRKTYFNDTPRRHLFMTLPRELGLPNHWVGRQVKYVYGKRDAGPIWEDTYRNALEAMGFLSSKASPCIFHHPGPNKTTVVHGDDFTSLGTNAALT